MSVLVTAGGPLLTSGAPPTSTPQPSAPPLTFVNAHPEPRTCPTWLLLLLLGGAY